MALATYSDLKTSLENWSHRSDLTSQLSDFIYLAERKISNNIISRKLQTSSSLPTSVGVNYVTLPSDYNSLKTIQLTSSYNTPLELISDIKMLESNSQNNQGRPQYYCIENQKIILSPIPDSVYSIDIVYYQDIPALSNSNTTNWVLTSYPYVYLYGALVELCTYVRDLENLALFKQNFQDAIEDMWDNFNNSSFSGSPIRSNSSYIA